MDFDVNVRERILRPLSQVFAAVVDPQKMCNYFISGASGPLKARTTVVWEFADVGSKVSIDVLEVEDNRKIVYESSSIGPRTRTTIQFDGPDATVVSIRLSEWLYNQFNIRIEPTVVHDGVARIPVVKSTLTSGHYRRV